MPRAAPAAERPAARTGRSFAELRRERDASAPSPAAEPAPGPSDEPESPAPAAEPAPVGEVDIDDVIVAWAEIQTGLPPATRAAVSAAQPLSVENGVITFGVPRAQYEVAVPRFRKEADNIRAALTRLLGRQMQFKPVPHDGFDADPATAPGADPDVASAPLDEEPPDDDEIDLADLIDEDSKGPAVDSVTLITQSLGATVVEEVPRD